MALESCIPECLWAERKGFIFLTVQLSSVENLKVDLKEESLDFSCTKGNKAYSFHLDFPDKIDVEASKYSTQRTVQFKLVKQESKRWHKVSVADKKEHWLKCDWDKWVDSDEEDNAQMNMGDFDMDSMGLGNMSSMLGKMGGMGGMDGMDLSSLGGGGDFGDMADSDDDDLKDLDEEIVADDTEKSAGKDAAQEKAEPAVADAQS